MTNEQRAKEIVLGIGSLEETADFVVLEQTIAKTLDDCQRELLDKVMPVLAFYTIAEPLDLHDGGYWEIRKEGGQQRWGTKARELLSELRKIKGE